MKVSDYVVEYLIEQGITDVFGYPGGMVTHLMDSFSKYNDKICAHVNYNEQASAFAACAYAQVTGRTGVAYATSGPGATNLITGIANAYFDSIPTVFITGQVNTYELSGSIGVRQKGFQETNIVEIVKPITKAAYQVKDEKKIRYYLEKAFHEANSGRQGPVLLDIPMNIQKSNISKDDLEGAIFFEANGETDKSEIEIKNVLLQQLSDSKRPCVILGNGIRNSGRLNELRQFIDKWKIPFVTSMIAFDILHNSDKKFGFIGAYGDRCANFIVAKSDLIISIGSRLDIRQVGADRANFAPNAKIIRVDIDPGELENKLHDTETQINLSAKSFIEILETVCLKHDFSDWLDICYKIKDTLNEADNEELMRALRMLSGYLSQECVVTTDVGQNQVWVAQSFRVKKGQQFLFSGGHGAMGYALPAAIGGYYATKKPVYCIVGDGGLQMNIQELQFIVREKIPIKILVINNNALGMIRHFQDMYFNKNYYQTKPEGGYSSPDFTKIAMAYGIEAYSFDTFDIDSEKNIKSILNDDNACLIELRINKDTYVYPKLEYGKPNQDQEPLIDRNMYDYLMDL